MKDRVKKYFEDTAKEFDDIYDNYDNFINKLFRKGMHKRFILTLKECKGNKTILDIGCGSGRIILPIAEKVKKVVGIDYSSQMIDLANKYKEKYKGDIKFICCDFMEDFDSEELFDITLALGVFDYIKDPIPFLKKMKRLTKEKMIASYPSKFTFQMPIRKIWLYTRKCPVYFYTKKDLESIYKSIGITNYEIVKVPAGYLVKAFLRDSFNNHY